MNSSLKEKLLERLVDLQSVRFMKDENLTEDYLPLPTNEEERKDIIRDMVHKLLRKHFQGCRTRPGSDNFSVRLDSEVNQKAEQVRELVTRSTEWSRWFDSNHHSLYSQVYQRLNAFERSGFFTTKRENERRYLTVYASPRNIRHFDRYGIKGLAEALQAAVVQENETAEFYDRTLELIEGEKARREEARRARIERERQELMQGIKDTLMKPLSTINATPFSYEAKFKSKMEQWARENGKDLVYAVELTDEVIMKNGTSVQIMSKDGETDAEWYAVPMFGGFEVPEGYSLKDRWGRVTGYSKTDARSRNGEAPIIIEGFLYLSFNMEHWKHTLPEGYEELLAATKRIELEAQEEFAYEEAIRREEERRKKLEEERILAEKLELKRQLDEEQSALREKYARLEQEKIAQLREELKKQFEEQPIEVKPEVVEEIKAAAPTGILAHIASLKHEPGVYKNSRALPFERYVVVHPDGKPMYFEQKSEAFNYARGAFVMSSDRLTYVYDYLDPKNRVERL